MLTHTKLKLDTSYSTIRQKLCQQGWRILTCVRGPAWFSNARTLLCDLSAEIHLDIHELLMAPLMCSVNTRG